MINKIAYLLVIISLFMSAANVNAAEDNTDMQILIANQKKGIVNSWSGAQPVLNTYRGLLNLPTAVGGG